MMNKKYLKHSSPEVFGLLNENIFHLSFSDIKKIIHTLFFKSSRRIGLTEKIGDALLPNVGLARPVPLTSNFVHRSFLN